jgi:hypothetical protein
MKLSSKITQMKDPLVKWFGYVGIIFIAGFVIVTLYITLGHSFSGLASTEAFISAFMGAFLTFILVKFAELGSHLRQLEKNSLNAIVTISHDMNDNLNKLHNNDFVAKDILSTLAKSKADPGATLNVNFNYFKALPIDRSQIIHLKNNLYLNEVFSYLADIEKLNDSMDTIQGFYNLIIRTKLSGQLDNDSYVVNINLIEKKIKELRKFINSATNTTVQLSAKAKLLLKYRSQWWRLVVRIKPMEEYKSSINDELESTIQSIWDEIHQTQDADTLKIKEIIDSEIE